MNSKVFILSLLLLASCASDNKTKTTSDSQTTSAQKSTTEPVKVMTDATLDLTKHGIANNPNNVLGGLKVGDIAPDIELENQNGKKISLENELKEGPVLLVFYRADWCSICRRHLAEFQSRIDEVSADGIAQVIAISPQKQEYSRKLMAKQNYSFPILFDQDHKTMKDYKVFFHVTDKYNQYITEAKGDPIEVRNGDTEPVMPVPATYMIGQDKRIKYVHYDPNYRERADVDEALKSIQG